MVKFVCKAFVGVAVRNIIGRFIIVPNLFLVGYALSESKTAVVASEYVKRLACRKMVFASAFFSNIITIA